jgi:uncharacterized protein (UPF0332 family)
LAVISFKRAVLRGSWGVLYRVHELRLAADYLATPVPLEKAKQAMDEAAAFVAAIRELLNPPMG